MKKNKIDRKNLVEVLNKLKPGLSQKAILDQIQCFIFTGEDIITYNDNISICYPYDDIENPFTIKSEEFLRILENMKSDYIEVSVGKDKIHIQDNKNRANLVIGNLKEVNKYIDTLAFYDLKDDDWNKLPKDFKEAIDISIFTAAKGEFAELFLTCLFFKGKEVISSDNQRVSIYEMKSKMDKEFLLPSDSAKHLLNFDVVEYYLDNSWIYFRTNDDIIFCSRIVSDEYPEDKAKESFNFKGEQIELPAGLIDAIASAEILAKEYSGIGKRIDVVINKAKVICKGEKEGIGEIESECKADISIDKNILFSIDPIFFKEILKKTNMMKIGADKAVFIMDKFKHLVAINFDE